MSRQEPRPPGDTLPFWGSVFSTISPHFLRSSEDLIRCERHRECKSGIVREVEANDACALKCLPTPRVVKHVSHNANSAEMSSIA
jgi:hypothetical protein